MKTEEKKYFYEMDSKWLNIISVILLVIMLFLTFTFTDISMDTINDNLLLLLLTMVPYLIFHEILHSIGYVVNGAKFNRIT